MVRRAVLWAACLLLAVPAWADGRLYDPTFRTGKPGDVLVEGDVPLRRGEVHAFVDLFESAFDLAFTAAQEQTLRDRVEIDFRDADEEARKAWHALVEGLPRLERLARTGEEAAVRDGLRAFRGSLDARMRADPDHPVHALLREVLERRYEPTWPGSPAIARQQADVYLEVAAFVTSAGRGTTVAPTPGQIDALRERLAEAMHAQPRAVRERIQDVHRLWLAAKAAWDRGGEPRRFPFRWRAVRLLAGCLPEGVEHEVEAGPTLADYAREAAAVAGRVPKAYDALASVSRDPVALLQAVEGGLKVDPASKAFTFALR